MLSPLLDGKLSKACYAAEFAIVDEAYPFVAKMLLTDDSPRLRAALKYMVSSLPVCNHRPLLITCFSSLFICHVRDECSFSVQYQLRLHGQVV